MTFFWSKGDNFCHKVKISFRLGTSSLKENLDIVIGRLSNLGVFTNGIASALPDRRLFNQPICSVPDAETQRQHDSWPAQRRFSESIFSLCRPRLINIVKSFLTAFSPFDIQQQRIHPKRWWILHFSCRCWWNMQPVINPKDNAGHRFYVRAHWF